MTGIGHKILLLVPGALCRQQSPACQPPAHGTHYCNDQSADCGNTLYQLAQDAILIHQQAPHLEHSWLCPRSSAIAKQAEALPTA